MNKIKKTDSIDRKILSDSRGWFLKVIDGNEENNPFPCEVYLTSAKPKESRGGHYHLKANEWFTLLSGKAKLVLEDIETKEMEEILLDSDKPETIFISPGVAHEFFNIGESDFLLLAYTDQKYDPKDTITHHSI